MLSFGREASAQKDKTKTDVHVIDFGDVGEKEKEAAPSYNGFILKTNPISFIFGQQWINLEKELSDFFSIQAGVGVTFGSLTGFTYDDLVSEIEDDGNCPDAMPCDDFTDKSYRTPKVGLYLSLAPRFFYESEGYEGAYISPVFRLSTTRYQVQKILEGASDEIRLEDSFQAETVRNMDIIIQYGYQYLHPRLTTEWFVGLGARLQKSKRQDIYYSDFGQYFNGNVTFKNTLLRVELGARVGFQL
jgi:hypothetical protein